MKGKQRRGKDKNADKDIDAGMAYVSTEAVRGVCAIFCIALAGFLILAQLGGGGSIGATLYGWLSWGLGVGYLLLPLSLALLATLIFRSFERNFGWVQFSAMTVFLLAGLGLINLAFEGRGGILGIGISNFIVSGVDVTATVIFLVAFIIASLVVAFDIHLGVLAMSIINRFRATPSDDVETDMHDVPVVGLPEEIPQGDEHEESVEETDAEDARKETRNPVTKFFSGGDTGAEGFPIIAASVSTYVPPPISILAKNKGMALLVGWRH